jgi:DNA-binding response OmpR family regulator
MSVQGTVLIIETGEAIRDTLAERLESEVGIAVSTAATLRQADRLLGDPRIRIDAVLLDVCMPDGDGRDFCLKIRRRGCKLPVILFSDIDSEPDIVRGLDSGANDFVAKPFRQSEVLARLRAQLRSFEISVDAILTIGQYIFLPGMRLLHDQTDNRRILLTIKETELLKFLYRVDGRAVHPKRLMREVWGYGPSTKSNTLQTHVYRLRKKMESDPAHPVLLVTDEMGCRLNTTEGA